VLHIYIYICIYVYIYIYICDISRLRVKTIDRVCYDDKLLTDQ